MSDALVADLQELLEDMLHNDDNYYVWLLDICKDAGLLDD